MEQHTTTGIGKGGKGGKGSGKGKHNVGIPKRFRTSMKQEGISNPSVRRLCRRAGIKRISGYLYEELNGIAAKFIENLLGYAIQYTHSGRRNTVYASDIVHACKRAGFPLYGFDL
jgi:histone H4